MARAGAQAFSEPELIGLCRDELGRCRPEQLSLLSG
jgi:hypothetical protein